MLIKRILMNAADPKGGGGGGDEPSLDDKIAEALAKALPKALNGAITSHLNRATSKFEERFKALEGKGGGDGDEDGGDPDGETPAGGAPGKGLSPEVAKQLAKMQKELERTQKQLAETTAAREKAEADARMREERGALQDALVAAGVQKTMLGPAVAYLYAEQKKIRRTDEGKVVFVGDDDEELSIADGVKAWAKTETGMGFLPPRPAGGSGGTGGKRPSGGGGAADPSDRTVVDLLLGNPSPDPSPG